MSFRLGDSSLVKVVKNVGTLLEKKWVATYIILHITITPSYICHKNKTKSDYAIPLWSDEEFIIQILAKDKDWLTWTMKVLSLKPGVRPIMLM